MRAALALAATSASALALAACGGGSGSDASSESAGTAGASTAAERCRAGKTIRLVDERRAFAGETRGRVTAYRAPGGRPLHTFPARTSLGATVVLGLRAAVLDRDCEPVWYRAQLPLRPNGRTGYVRARDVRVYRVATRIVVDLSARRLEVLRAGERVLAVTAGVGSERTPTPTGSFYVNQKVRVTDPEGPYGPAVLGVSAFSDVLTGWAEGGPIAIHGTSDPRSIGRAASNGCVRVGNDVVARLFREIDAGTPVMIRA